MSLIAASPADPGIGVRMSTEQCSVDTAWMHLHMKNNSNRATSPARGVVIAALCALLGGCAVTPKPLTDDDNRAAVRRSLERVAAGQEPIAAPIGLYEAMARALKYNLDYRVELMTQALRQSEVDLTRYDLLPQLAANAGFTSRSNDAGASSRSLLSGRESLEPSTSTERTVTTSDLTLSWDILDFGLSYVRAHQKADESLAAMEQRRKVANRIIEDVRTAYWRAVSAERLLGKMKELETSVLEALEESRSLEKRGATAPLAALTFQRELIQIRAELQRLQRDLVVAKRQLGALMNVPPDQDFQLALPARVSVPARLDMAPRDMMVNALFYRPELRDVRYRARINQRELDAVLLRALPSLRAVAGLNYDSNHYVYNHDWVGVGARASWNLINVFRYPAHRQAVENQQALLEQRELALTMAVMTEVYVSNTRLSHLNGELATAGERLDVQTRILDKVRSSFRAGSVSRQTLIREEMNMLTEEVRHDIVFADLQNARANTYAAMGLDTFSPDVSGREGVAALAASLERLWTRREQSLGRTLSIPSSEDKQS
jgi:outer membrane protein TolC